MSDHNSRLLGEIEQDGVYAAPLLRVRAARETAALLRGLRKQAGLTQQAIAAKLGVSQARISQVESGVLDFLPPLDFIYLFADACGARLSLHAGAKDVAADAATNQAVPAAVAVEAVAASRDEDAAAATMPSGDVHAGRLRTATIRTYRVFVRDTEFGPEKVTRDIPNIPDEALQHLDENGIAKVGTQLQPGDILVGKVAPVDERSTADPESRLLRAIFGKKPLDDRDTSARMPPGISGTVLKVRNDDRSSGKLISIDIATEGTPAIAVSRAARRHAAAMRGAVLEDLDVLANSVESQRAALDEPAAARPAQAALPVPPRALKESE